VNVVSLPRRWAAMTLMLASGFAGLGYQIIWTQQCGLWLGHESAAVLAVVAAFFAGLAAGALVLGPRIERSGRPRRWYVGCEIAIAAWALLLLAMGPSLGRALQQVIGPEPSALRHWLVAFGGTFGLLLPGCAAMGATLPAMERLTAPLRQAGRSISELYAANTLGAVLGTLVSAFWLIPGAGLAASAALCASLNVLCAAAACFALPGALSPSVKKRVWPAERRLPALLALTGLLGIGYEVLVVRALSQLTENTVYTFALVLAVYLMGSALGAAAYARWLEGRRDEAVLEGQLLAALAAACLLGTSSLWFAEASKAAVLEMLGPSLTTALLVEAALAVIAFGLPTLAMGAAFSHLNRAALAAGMGLGRALGINLLAAATAPALLGVLAAPLVGLKPALLLVSTGYLLPLALRSRSRKLLWAPALAAAALAALLPPLRFIAVPEGGRLLHYEDGVMAAVSVVEDESGVRRLHINNRQQEGSSGTRHVDARQAWLPLLLHAAPQRALFLGLGTGVTASAAADDPSLAVDVVELLPEVVAASSHFSSDERRARLRVATADARRYVRASPRRYDVIVSDNFHPARSGSGTLYTIEHFGAVRERLARGGLFCQWLPLHQLDLESFRSIVASFLAVYPRGWALLASNSLDTPVIGLVARADQGAFDAAAVEQRLQGLSGAPFLAGLGLEDELAVLGSFAAGPAALASFAKSAVANTDERPIVAYRAPRLTYAPDSEPAERLLALLGELSIAPGELVPLADEVEAQRLGAYWSARNQYLVVGRGVRPAERVEDMLVQVREPLLSVLRLSPDFRPAYDPLLRMAAALGRSNVSAARELLLELVRIQPARAEASRLLTVMGEATAASASHR
jgi:spermidine synthase